MGGVAVGTTPLGNWKMGVRLAGANGVVALFTELILSLR
jgi:hypothetical protein